ncbi:MAG: type III PLP-dependent enzyme [Gammaproteobacteria bacterium]|nr:MAG: type III PLP-dependent enzyme [Gammaproteobacteria bacterium]
MNNAVKEAIHSLAASGDRPFCAYLYDLHGLEQHIRAMTAALPDNVQLFYAAKANPDARVLATLSPWVDGFEAASGGELEWLYQRHPDKPLIFGGPGKLASELATALERGIDTLHVESQTELRRLATLTASTGRTAAILLRMNIPLEDIGTSKLAMGGRATQFGLDPRELEEALALIAHSPGLRLQGFHFHLMSHQCSARRHLDLMALYFRTFKQWCQTYHIAPPLLNVGGGMGIDYGPGARHFDWSWFCGALGELIASEKMAQTTIRFECGRFISAQCGYYVMEVLDIKHSHGEYFAIGRGGTHHFRTPAAQSHSHPFVVVPGKHREGEIRDARVTLAGQLCTPKDVLASRQHVSSLAIGDYLVFPLAGAYSWNISHQNFLMHPPPQFHYL